MATASEPKQAQPIVEKEHHPSDEQRDPCHDRVAVGSSEADHQKVDPDASAPAERAFVLLREEEEDERGEETSDEEPVVNRRSGVSRDPERKHRSVHLLHEIPLSEPGDPKRRVDAQNEGDRPAGEPVAAREEAREEHDAERERDEEEVVPIVREVREERLNHVGIDGRDHREHDVIAGRDPDEEMLAELVYGVFLVEKAENPEREEGPDPDSDVRAQMHG